MARCPSQKGTWPDQALQRRGEKDKICLEKYFWDASYPFKSGWFFLCGITLNQCKHKCWSFVLVWAMIPDTRFGCYMVTWSSSRYHEWVDLVLGPMYQVSSVSQEYLVPDTMFWQGCGTWSQGTGVRYQISDLRGIPGETAAEGETTSLMCNHLSHICHN